MFSVNYLDTNKPVTKTDKPLSKTENPQSSPLPAFEVRFYRGKLRAKS
jgi:hypothetical protein